LLSPLSILILDLTVAGRTAGAAGRARRLFTLEVEGVELLQDLNYIRDGIFEQI
jgi:hypothetical protein